MAGTLAADPEPDAEACRFYLTAVPTRGRPDMLLGYTRDPAAHRHFMTTANEWHNAIARTDNGQRGHGSAQIAFGSLIDTRRGSGPAVPGSTTTPRARPTGGLGHRGARSPWTTTALCVSLTWRQDHFRTGFTPPLPSGWK